MRRRDGLSFHRREAGLAPSSSIRVRLAAVLLLGVALGCTHHGPGGEHARHQARGHACDDAGPSGGDAGRQAELQAAVDRLVATLEIEQLKARFMRCVDTKNLACLRDEVFAPGAEIHFRGTDYDISAVGWAEIEKFYQGAFTPTKFGMHHAHTPEIRVDGETARGTWYLHDVFVNLEEGWTLQGSALYDDSYARLDGEWRIMYSTYERLWEETTPRDPKTKLGSKSVRE